MNHGGGERGCKLSQRLNHWSDLEFHHSTKWRVSRHNVPEKGQQQIVTQKFILAVIVELMNYTSSI
jgi:hypothetical protein